ncbi:hypothetical protein F4815DRAFT_449881 [Daldinia loculata]|nr:hypothetical protein F4815DRAFT_449881 [Daldinia loculata]
MGSNLRVPIQEAVVYTWEVKDIIGVILVVIFLFVVIAAINAALWGYCGDAQRRQQQQPAQEEHELQHVGPRVRRRMHHRASISHSDHHEPEERSSGYENFNE